MPVAVNQDSGASRKLFPRDYLRNSLLDNKKDPERMLGVFALVVLSCVSLPTNFDAGDQTVERDAVAEVVAVRGEVRLLDSLDQIVRGDQVAPHADQVA